MNLFQELQQDSLLNTGLDTLFTKIGQLKVIQWIFQTMFKASHHLISTKHFQNNASTSTTLSLLVDSTCSPRMMSTQSTEEHLLKFVSSCSRSQQELQRTKPSNLLFTPSSLMRKHQTLQCVLRSMMYVRSSQLASM